MGAWIEVANAPHSSEFIQELGASQILLSVRKTQSHTKDGAKTLEAINLNRKKPTLTNTANRGLPLESLIDLTNQRYSLNDIAEIQKIPSNWLPIRDHRGKVVSAKIQKPSTVDYLGRYGGAPIAFDAKSVQTQTKWYLSKLPQHQFDFLERWQKCGLSFILLGFWATEEFFFLPFGYIRIKYNAWLKGGGASLDLTDIREEFPSVKPGGKFALDYLSIAGKARRELKLW